MKKVQFLLKAILLLTFLSFSFVDLDPAYIKAFGYGTICVSTKGYPEKDKYDASKFDYKYGKFYVSKGGRIDLRAILPEGKTYGDFLSAFKKSNSAMYKDVVEEMQYIKVFTSHLVGGIQAHFGSWPSDPSELVNTDATYFLNFTTSPESLSWNTSGIKWDDTKTGLQLTVGNWLEYAQPGWQMYILETVGWTRECPERKYWDWDRGKYIFPYGYELAPPHAYCIVEVK